MRQAFLPSLREAGVPEKTIQIFIMGQMLTSKELAALPKSQAQAVESAQQASASMSAANGNAIALARQRCAISLAVCAGLGMLGVGLSARAVRRVRAQRRVPPLLHDLGQLAHDPGVLLLDQSRFANLP